MTGSAERMRRLRQRRDDGRVVVVLELDPAAVTAMVKLGWLAHGHRDDPAAVKAALSWIAGEALDDGWRAPP